VLNGLATVLRTRSAQRLLRSHWGRRAAIGACRRWEFRDKPLVYELFGLRRREFEIPEDVRWVECIEGLRLTAHSSADHMFHVLYIDRLYQPDVLVALRNLLKPGDTFWDVGANYGFMSLYVSRVFGNSVRTVAFEPSPVVLPYLRENITANDAAVDVQAYGLGDRVGTAEFFYSELGSWNGTLLEEFAEHHCLPRKLTVPVMTIDAAMATLPKPSVLKIDVEGAELQTLAGGEKFLSEHHPPLVVEYNIESMSEPGDEFLARFRDLGYTPHVMPRPRFGWYRWEQLHPVIAASGLPSICNLILLATNSEG
jgi:FkbM family methyltransferase